MSQQTIAGRERIRAEKASKQQSTYHLIKQMIDQGRIRPGEKLLEVQIAKAFGISRSPARIALRALCDARLVRELPGRGYEVAGRSKRTDVGQVALLDDVRIESPRQWERVYEQAEQEICERILFEKIRVVEPRFAEYFGVSRTVARDVLARMQSVGLVTKNGGHWVAEQVSTRRIGHLFEIRRLLEPEALRQAAVLVAPAELERMRDWLLQTLKSHPIDTELIGQAEDDLHIVLLSRCPNREITNALLNSHLLFVASLSSAGFAVPQEIIEAMFREHLEVVEHLLNGKTNKAMASLKVHLQGAENRWFQRFEVAEKLPRKKLPPYLVAFADSSPQ